MDKQVALLREDSDATSSSSIAGFFFSTTTAAPTTTTTAIYTNAQIDAFGRSYANLAFADFTNNAPTQYFYAPESYDQQ
uniref:Uncharacterized protein n=1 Tax=Panagrolaimus sp. ES5 TaxID=591445 RepID=A0AC34FFC7_9BILA